MVPCASNSVRDHRKATNFALRDLHEVGFVNGLRNKLNYKLSNQYRTNIIVIANIREFPYSDLPGVWRRFSRLNTKFVASKLTVISNTLKDLELLISFPGCGRKRWSWANVFKSCSARYHGKKNWDVSATENNHKITYVWVMVTQTQAPTQEMKRKKKKFPHDSLRLAYRLAFAVLSRMTWKYRKRKASVFAPVAPLSLKIAQMRIRAW